MGFQLFFDLNEMGHFLRFWNNYKNQNTTLFYNCNLCKLHKYLTYYKTFILFLLMNIENCVKSYFSQQAGTLTLSS
jgi:hypothetical protein